MAYTLSSRIENGELDTAFASLYGEGARTDAQRTRYIAAVANFRKQFGTEPEHILSSPGRTEICGNHCDHQKGCVVAAAVNSDIIAVIAPSEDNCVHIFSEGYGMIEVGLDDLDAKKNETGKSSAMVRGIAAALKNDWITPQGFCAYLTSNVPAGSGISSSAAFENIIANAFGCACGRKFEPRDIARMGKFAENNYFGKPSGLMDQMAAACGGLIYIDFEHEDYPEVVQINCDFSKAGCSICIVNTGSSHADLTGDYASIPADMKKAASFFGKRVLREVDEQTFYERLPRLRSFSGERPVLRAMHFFEESRRSFQVKDALEQNDFERFFELIRLSGDSSWKYLQNIHSPGSRTQELALALAVSEKILAGRGACRVHGGGFAGTIQAFVPDELVPLYREEMERIFKKDACRVLSIRQVGGCMVI